MADPALFPAENTGPGTDPARRGSLSVHPRVVDKIARRAVADVPGVATETAGALDQVLGRRLPSVDTDLAGRRARLTIEIAIGWPQSAGDVAAAVRSRVAQQVSRLIGIDVDAVDVTVARVSRRRRTE